MKNPEQVRSLVLAFLMVGSVMVGVFYLDIDDVGLEQPPAISAEEPGDFVIGEVLSIKVTIVDEALDELVLDVTLDGDRVANVYLDDNGSFVVDISHLDVGLHALKVIARDKNLLETRWFTEFTISYPAEDETRIDLDHGEEMTVNHGDNIRITGNLTHSTITSCIFIWTDAQLAESSLGMPMTEEGDFYLDFSNMQENLTITMEATCGVNIITVDSKFVNITVIPPGEGEGGDLTQGCTDPEAENYDAEAEEDDGSCTYDGGEDNGTGEEPSEE